MRSGIYLTVLILIAEVVTVLFDGAPAPLAAEAVEMICAELVSTYDDPLQTSTLAATSISVGECRLTGPGAVQPATALQSRDTACTHSLFEQPWWLDAVAPGNWGAATVISDGEIVGRLPYVRMRRFGVTILGQPPLTQFLGPWIKPESGTTYERLEREHDLMRDLIAALPRHDVFIQECHHSIRNCLPFYWRGFSESVRYTYIIDELDDLDKIWGGFRETVRGHIRKAERQVVVRSVDDIEIFLSLNEMVYDRQGIGMPYSPDLVRHLDAACSARNARRIFLAEGANGVPHATLYLVWDPESAYCLMSGSDPRLRHSGAISLLRWEAIKFAGQVTRRFDFEGSMLQPVERFIRTFGGRQVQFPRLLHAGTLKGQLALMAYEWSHARKRRSRALIAATSRASPTPVARSRGGQMRLTSPSS